MVPAVPYRTLMDNFILVSLAVSALTCASACLCTPAITTKCAIVLQPAPGCLQCKE